MSELEAGIGIAGLIIAYHAGPRFLVPPVRPFTCSLCLAFWAGAVRVYFVGPEGLYGLGIAVAAAALISTLAPWTQYATDE